MSMKLTVKKWLPLISSALGISENDVWKRCLYFNYEALEDDGIQVVSIDWTKDKELRKFRDENKDLPIAVIYPNFKVDEVKEDTLNDRLLKDMMKLNQSSKHFEFMMKQKVTYKSFAIYKSKLQPVITKLQRRYKTDNEKNVMIIGKNKAEIAKSMDAID